MIGAERERSGRKIRWARAEGERECRRAWAERIAGVTKVGLSGERQIGRSRSAHMLWSPFWLSPFCCRRYEQWPF